MTEQFHIGPTRVDFSDNQVKSGKILQADVYTGRTQMRGPPYLLKKEFITDDILTLPSAQSSKIRLEVNNFLHPDTKKAFAKYNMLYKRGLLMYGEPGTGKTCILHDVMKDAIAKDMIVLLDTEPALVKYVVEKIREIEGNNRPFLVIWEEFENTVYNSEDEVLALLDGMEQVSNIFFIATTNYLKQIPPRIRNRPSRFADVIQIGPPCAEARREYLTAKIHASDNVDMDHWVESTEGLNIDQIKDVLISTLVLQLPLKDSVTKIKEMGSLLLEE